MRDEEAKGQLGRDSFFPPSFLPPKILSLKVKLEDTRTYLNSEMSRSEVNLEEISGRTNQKKGEGQLELNFFPPFELQGPLKPDVEQPSA